MTTKQEMAEKAKRTLAIYEAKVTKMERELASAVAQIATLKNNIAHYEEFASPNASDNAVRPKQTPKKYRPCGQS